jgi:hypothetical protein
MLVQRRGFLVSLSFFLCDSGGIFQTCCDTSLSTAHGEKGWLDYSLLSFEAPVQRVLCKLMNMVSAGVQAPPAAAHRESPELPHIKVGTDFFEATC